MPRIGFLSNGGAWLSACTDLLADEMSLQPRIFDTSHWRPQRISQVDVLLIPWAPDAEWIRRRRSHLLRFLDGGGVLLAFGEFESDWLPGMIWAKTIEDDVKITEEQLSPEGMRARRVIFDGLDSAKLSNWYDSCHGYFRVFPKEHADVLATNHAGQPVVVLDASSFKGALLASSIDPDFHTYAQNPNARKMFKQVVEWAMVYAEEEGGYRQEIRLPKRSEMAKAINEVLPTVAVDVAVALVTAVVTALAWPF
jgi:hypothetical protein